MERIPASVPRHLPHRPILRYIHPDFTQQTMTDLWVSLVTADYGGVPDTFIHIHRLFIHTYYRTHNRTRSRWTSRVLGGSTHTFNWMIQQPKYFQHVMYMIVFATCITMILCSLLAVLSPWVCTKTRLSRSLFTGIKTHRGDILIIQTSSNFLNFQHI